ncbi:MAG: diguanylate cyclase [Deferribacteres bacterium]|nr:diguanylate cyclase [Deferribacteres bacterium]
MINKLINFITFVDLPIRKKFLLFFLGVLFWFVVMFLTSVLTNVTINNRTDRIAGQVMPLDRISRKIARKLQRMSIDAAGMQAVADINEFNRKIDISRTRLMDIRSFLSALELGGQVYDIDRDNNKLIERLTVKPLTAGEKFSSELLPLIDTLDMELAGLADSKLSGLNTTQQDSGLTADKIHKYRQTLSSAMALSDSFSSRTTKMFASDLRAIQGVATLSFYIQGGVLVTASLLLLFFTLSISRSIAGPVKSIIQQIRSLGEGEVDLSKKITVRSKDEIGALSEDFNHLMEEIHDMATFKKVIEEDDSLEDVYSRLGRVFKENFGLDKFIIYEVSNSRNKMKPVYPVILDEKEIFCSEDVLHNSELCKVKKTGHTISSATYPGICKQFRPDIGKVHICIPMIISGKTGGVVQFLLDKENFRADGKDKRIFRAGQYIKESLSVIEAKRLMNTLRESALKDSLTGLYNRRFLQEYTETLIAGVLRREKTVGLIMCDLDFFKQVNDLYGHSIGDMVLKETSSVLRKCIRTADLVIRFGGEEFLVLMLDINEGETINVAEKIRETMENTRIKVSDGTIKKTISLGISEFPADTESFWQAIKFADVALYKAKEAGRNKVVRFNKEMWTENQF